MCGISGIYRSDGPVRDEDRHAVRTMMDVLRHRGPDDEGFYSSASIVFGHNRLSIIDIDSGHQPMANEDESIWITYNGEIYNYIELRDTLEKDGVSFRTQSDTEVVLKLYERYGVDCVDHLNGMFAIAIWDEREQRLVLCRDRLGIKPLYYAWNDKCFCFASEIKALVKSGLVKPALNTKALSDYIALQLSLTDETLFKGVQKLSPGQRAIINVDGIKCETYWSIDFSVDEDSADNESVHVEELNHLLHDAVRMQVRSDVPVGAHLSGGLDSSAVCCLASNALGGKLDTFTGFFPEGGVYDESKYARDVTKEFGSAGHFIEIDERNVVDSLERLVYFMDEPQAGPGLIPQYEVSKLAKSAVKVALSGLGGDETFGGYAKYYLAYLEECLKGAINETQQVGDGRFVVSFESLLPNLPLLREYQPLMKKFWAKGLFGPESERYFSLMRRGNGTFSGDVYDDAAAEGVCERFDTVFHASNAQSLLNKMLAFDLSVFIPGLLQVEDRTSMAVSLESRVPLLDHRIVEMAAKMPPTIKWKGGRPKHVFREAVRDLVPESIWQRKDKRGFPTPITEWFNGPLKGYVHEIMTSKRARERGLYDQSLFSESRVTSHELRSFDRSLWGALCIELWHRQFIDS